MFRVMEWIAMIRTLDVEFILSRDLIRAQTGFTSFLRSVNRRGDAERNLELYTVLRYY
jgi:hypothetical protein